MIIELTDVNGQKTFINKNKIVHFYRVEANYLCIKESYTQILLDACSIQVKEDCETIAYICNKL